MNHQLHPDFRVDKRSIGREKEPLLVIDNLLANAEQLVDIAAAKVFAPVETYFPGIRAKVPLTYQQFIVRNLGGLFSEFFGLPLAQVRFSNCHFSLVTTPADRLSYLQRIPHVDSYFGSQLAFVHYLFKSPLGGTAFYRQKSTGFEYVDQSRQLEYTRRLEEERTGPHAPAPAYINGDTALYEKLDGVEGVFNRLLVYRRNSLHSGSIAADFVPDRNPRSGRLSVNGFLN